MRTPDRPTEPTPDPDTAPESRSGAGDGAPPVPTSFEPGPVTGNPVPLSGRAPDLGQVPAFGQTPDLGQVPAFGQTPDLGQAPVLGRAPVFGQAPVADPPSGYGRAPTPAPAYGVGAGYGGAAGYRPAPAWSTTRPVSVRSTSRNALGTWSLVLGIIGMFVCALLAGIPAVITGVLSRRAVARGEATNGGQAVAGIVLGLIGTAWGLFVLFVIQIPILTDLGGGR